MLVTYEINSEIEKKHLKSFIAIDKVKLHLLNLTVKNYNLCFACLLSRLEILKRKGKKEGQKKEGNGPFLTDFEYHCLTRIRLDLDPAEREDFHGQICGRS